MRPIKEDFVIVQGADFDDAIAYLDEDDQPVDLTGWSARMQLRSSQPDETVILELQTADSTILLGGTNGVIQFNLTGAQTAVLDFDRAVYDLFLYGPAAGEPAQKPLEGIVILDRSVTR